MVNAAQEKKPEPTGKYVFISEGSLVAQAVDIDEAVQVKKMHSNATVFERSYDQTVEQFEKYQKKMNLDVKVEPNEVAITLSLESEYEFGVIEAELTREIPDASFDSPISSGYVRLETGERRPCTNEEGAIVKHCLYLSHNIDLREDLMSQTATWLNSVGQALLRAAKAIGECEDRRCKDAIRALMTEEGLLARMEAEGMVFGFDMEILPLEEYDQQIKELEAMSVAEQTDASVS